MGRDGGLDFVPLGDESCDGTDFGHTANYNLWTRFDRQTAVIDLALLLPNTASFGCGLAHLCFPTPHSFRVLWPEAWSPRGAPRLAEKMERMFCLPKGPQKA